jgi:tRNA(adenine34) deaminase
VRRDELDSRLMARCIALSREGSVSGELPFGSLVARGPDILAESANCTKRERDLSRHAEIVAIAQARKAAGDGNLRGCTIYSTVEPCAMCSYCIRESGIGRVVFALASPVMGGLSARNILGSDTLSDQSPFVFGTPPQVSSGVLADEAVRAWREWNRVAWWFIRSRGFLVVPGTGKQVARGNPAGSLRHLMRLFGSRTR